MSTKIEWTEQTWNPTVGCTKISPGCTHCYAESMAIRLKAMGVKGYENGFKLTLLPDRLNDPLLRKKPTIYFVNSMSDLFHEDVPFEYIDQVMNTIKKTPHHIFQILTKRAERMVEYFNQNSPSNNVWLGVTVENKKYGLPRIDLLRQINAKVRFLSIEPLLEDLEDINLTGIGWVIAGGESGNKARPMKKEWAENIRDQCKSQKVPFFFKQWGTWNSEGQKNNKKQNGRYLDGKIWNQMPKAFSLK